MSMKKIYVLVFLCVVTASVYAQKLSGVITDAFTREPLIGVSILNTDNGTGTVTDLDGHYELLITTLPAHLQFSYVGYQTEDKVLKTIPAKYDLVLQADNEVLDEVVVTAGRFEQRMTDVTVSMEVVKPQVIRSQAPTDLSATLQTLPGVEIIDKQPSIRGGGGWTYSVGSRCQVLMDEMTILNPKTGEINWNNVPLENVAQVEVVKGASSVLYGSSALNGVINVRTQRPGLTPQTKVSGYVGIYDNYKNYAYTGARLPLYYGAEASHARRVGNFDVSGSISGFKDEGFDIGEAEACVTPVHIKGGIAQATKMAKDLRENYRIFCSMVIYPVIPKGMIIFRIVSTAAHTMEDVEYTLKVFKEIKAKLDAGLYDGDDIAAMTVK